MNTTKDLSPDQYRYLKLLAEKYPTMQEVCTEIINLQAILNLPKGTEHFMSDLHGEYEAFYHILNNCSGVIREKVDELFSTALPDADRSELCTLIYYPREKLDVVVTAGKNTADWYRITLERLISVAKLLSSKYTRSKVRKAMPPAYSYIIDELLHAQLDENTHQFLYHKKIIDTLISLKNGNAFIEALALLIKRLAVDHLHIVGDIFDRGARPDAILDMLMDLRSLDIAWGNHDILWMGAAAGNTVSIAGVVRNSLSYRNMDVLEKGYGISLRPLSLFATKTYPCENPVTAALKTISIILFKLEGQLIRRNEDYGMNDRLLLDKIDPITCNIVVDEMPFPLKSMYFPTIDLGNPYQLTEEEAQIIEDLKTAFRESERLHRHVRFLYEKGAIYYRFNGNLLFHGCIPLDANGAFEQVTFDQKTYSGRSYLDYADQLARQAYFGDKSQKSVDFLWYLWCGSKSPLSGRTIKTLERTLIEDPKAWKEPQNAYYDYCNSEATCRMILKEFDLCEDSAHIINGHVPVRVVKGESPVKANGRLFVIDGGFCRAYQKTTGIAGYTLIYNSRGLRLMSHQPFTNIKKSLEENQDIESTSTLVEMKRSCVTVGDTDTGKELRLRIEDLRSLLQAYKDGSLPPQNDIL